MPTPAVVLWLANIVLDTAGHLAFKSAAVTEESAALQRWRTMLASPRLWAGIVSFALEFVVWLALLSLIPLSQAVLIGSINIVIVMLAGRFFYRERLDRRRVAAMGLIAVGVALAGGFV